MFDSTIRLKQMNQAELSGFLVPIILSYLTNTGSLTGSFYPLKTNPSGYEQSGAFIDKVSLDSAIYQALSYVANTYYPNSNPSGFINSISGAFYPLNTNPSGYITTGQTGAFGGGGTGTQSGSYIFNTYISSGVSNQFISFPVNLGSSPFVLCALNNQIGPESISVQVSGISSSGFWAQFSNSISNTGFVLTTLSSISTVTGFSPTIIVQSGGGGRQLSFLANCTSGANQEFITFPQILTGIPNVSCSFRNGVDNNLYFFNIFGVNTSGFQINYSDFLARSGYQLDVITNL